MHVEKIRKYENAIDEKFTKVEPFLVQSVAEINRATERIQSRETHLNSQFDDLLHIYRQKQNELAAIIEKYRCFFRNIYKIFF